jgi:hypothetical protein
LGYKRTIIDVSKLKEDNGNKIDKNLKDNLITNLCLDISNGEYPNRCFTHIFGAYILASKEEIRDKYLDEFKSKSFFLQKIYDMNSINKENHFSHRNENHKNNLLLINKETNSREDEAWQSSLSTTKYKDYLIKGSQKCALLDFNVNTFFWWEEVSNSPDFCFGFSIKDNFLKEYLEKSAKYLIDNNIRIYYQNFELADMKAIFFNLILMDKNFQKLLDSKEEPTEELVKNTINDIILSLESKFGFSMKKYNPNKEERDDDKDIEIVFFKIIEENINFLYKSIRYKYDTSSLPITNIPIFINHDEIPQLSWGHAKYAHFFNQKGFNFFEFKHADHLPSKE